MKAIYAGKFGGPEILELQDVEKTSVKPNEVLVKVPAASLNAAEFGNEDTGASRSTKNWRTPPD